MVNTHGHCEEERAKLVPVIGMNLCNLIESVVKIVINNKYLRIH